MIPSTDDEASISTEDAKLALRTIDKLAQNRRLSRIDIITDLEAYSSMLDDERDDVESNDDGGDDEGFQRDQSGGFINFLSCGTKSRIASREDDDTDHDGETCTDTEGGAESVYGESTVADASTFSNDHDDNDSMLSHPSLAPNFGGKKDINYDCDGPTTLYSLIEKRNWKDVPARARSDPIEASIWVFRMRETKLRWRVLPLHAACIFKAPFPVIDALLRANPDSPMLKDDAGKLPIHLASHSGATEEVILSLLKAFPESCELKDNKGRTPLVVAVSSDSPYKDEMIHAIRRFKDMQLKKSTSLISGIGPNLSSISVRSEHSEPSSFSGSTFTHGKRTLQNDVRGVDGKDTNENDEPLGFYWLGCGDRSVNELNATSSKLNPPPDEEVEITLEISESICNPSSDDEKKEESATNIMGPSTETAESATTNHTKKTKSWRSKVGKMIQSR